MPKLLIAHVVFMAISVTLIITAVTIARRRKEGWFKRHRIFALSGALCALIAFAIIYAFKVSASFPHFKSPHAIAGGISLILLIFTPASGILLVSGKNGLRKIHRTFGKITSLATLLTAAMGEAKLYQILKG